MYVLFFFLFDSSRHLFDILATKLTTVGVANIVQMHGIVKVTCRFMCYSVVSQTILQLLIKEELVCSGRM